MVPVGIYDLAVTGSLLWANSHFYDIMGVSPDGRDPSRFDWTDYIFHEDRGRADIRMAKAVMEKIDISDELRLNKHWTPPKTAHDAQVADVPFWVLYSACPDIKSDGSVHSLMGCIADISHLKWAEQLQIRNAEVALKEKQRQEEFIDITSHEMRNPLSAITQCADSIILSLYDAEGKTDSESLIDIIKLNVEAAESILFCAAHQRRIIDDVLTLGKLDSKLLTISPIAFHPHSVVADALQMFKADFESSSIEVQTIFDGGEALSARFLTVYADVARLMQILVNLLTNAIKFTRLEGTRKITIRFGSSDTAPTADMFGPNFQWNPTERLRPDLTQEPEYGKGRVVYLYYAVVDSGRGIPDEHAHKLFTKFEQADRRTHTKYGGSGLGLFISRELTEMQGGQIGIQSKEAAGSTFAFYIKARCTDDHVTGHPNAKGQEASSRVVKEAAVASLKAEGKLTSSSVESTSKMFPPPTASYSILLVEDNLLNQRVLAKQLQRAGCMVEVVNHGGEAIDYVLQCLNQAAEYGSCPKEMVVSHIDCILMDWEMPVCDGLKATERIREIERQHGTPSNIIIGVTANARAEQISRAMEAGMDIVTPKPFRVPELLVKIGQFVKEDGQKFKVRAADLTSSG